MVASSFNEWCKNCKHRDERKFDNDGGCCECVRLTVARDEIRVRKPAKYEE